jgi:hypothetical protein
MPKKRHKPEEIVAKLRQVDVLVAQGQSVSHAIRSIGVTRGRRQDRLYRARQPVFGRRRGVHGRL